MALNLNEIELRVLGALMEKENATPEYYPLSLNALVNACNQKTSRDPVMNLTEGAVRQALETLRERGLAEHSEKDSRVPKFGHRLQEVYNFDRRESAVLCVLLLRGPQTPGELRGRTERQYHFEDLSAVQTTLQRLTQRDPALVAQLPREPGDREARFAHLLGGEVESWTPPPQSSSADFAPDATERLAQLEERVVIMESEIADLKQQFAEFRKQFE